MLDLIAKAIRRAGDHPGKHTLASNGSLEIPCSDLCDDVELCDFEWSVWSWGSEERGCYKALAAYRYRFLNQHARRGTQPQVWKLILTEAWTCIIVVSVCFEILLQVRTSHCLNTLKKFGLVTVPHCWYLMIRNGSSNLFSQVPITIFLTAIAWALSGQFTCDNMFPLPHMYLI